MPGEPLVTAASRRARCQRSWNATSATATPRRPWSWALMELSSLRLPFRLPASGKCRSTTRTATKPLPSIKRPVAPSGDQLALDLPRRVGLQHVAFFDIGVVAQHDTALITAAHLARVL